MRSLEKGQTQRIRKLFHGARNTGKPLSSGNYDQTKHTIHTKPRTDPKRAQTKAEGGVLLFLTSTLKPFGPDTHHLALHSTSIPSNQFCYLWSKYATKKIGLTNHKPLHTPMVRGDGGVSHDTCMYCCLKLGARIGLLPLTLVLSLNRFPL